MISVKGKFKNGVALPLEPVEKSHEGRSVIITFLDEQTKEVLLEKTNGAKSLEDLIAECEVDMGIADLAEQHDHYLYGKPKK
ncbi:MAG: hypothetical protein H0W58_13810 [Acidobacteria bacterium]|nr:hypothetical protein [Acidobacteriota bacterium]